jgi:hypothetical protein
MAVELKFTSTQRSELQTELIAHCNQNNEIYIEIKEPDERTHDWDYQFICLDKETAIKLAKELRKQISMLEG